jgi:cell division transport system permease protein
MARTRPNYLYAIASVALVLYVLGFFGLMMLHGQKLVTFFKEKVDLWIELKPGLAEQEVARIIQEVRQNPMVKPESVSFITQEQAAATMREDLGDDSMMEDMPDLLRDVVRFHVKAEYLDKTPLQEWKEQLQQDTLVSALYFEVANTNNVGKNIQNLGLVPSGWPCMQTGSLLKTRNW